MEKWENDNDFEEQTITGIVVREYYYTFTTYDNWNFIIKKNNNIIPRVGMNVRFYGRGIKHPIRGLMIDGKMIFYKTRQEQDEIDKQSRVERLHRARYIEH